MSNSAIIMMLVAMATVWGGLAWAVLNLKRNPDISETEE